MKQFICACLFLLGSVVAFSQSEIGEKKSTYGIYMGLNHSDLTVKELPTNAVILTGLGFQLGILADFHYKNWLSFSPKAELSFNTANIDIANSTTTETYQVMPVNVGLIGHLKFKIPNNRLEPYVYVGPHYRLSLTQNTGSSSEFPTESGLSFDIGIGTTKVLERFAFAPELRYSHGLGNVNGNPLIQNTTYHNLSLIFNFLR